MLSKRNKVSAVIFDLDGTLVDSFSACYYVFNKGISEFNLKPVSKEFLVESLKKGISLGEMIRKILPTYCGEFIIKKCKDRILELFLKIEAKEALLYPEVIDLFKGLKERGIKIGIATGRMSHPEDEWRRFKRFGLVEFIGAIVTSREVERRKPEPDIIIECAKRLDTFVKECLVVGDTESDVIAAKRAEAISALIYRGDNYNEFIMNMNEKPEFVFGNLNELIPLLK